MGRNLLPLMTCMGMRNLLRNSRNGLTEEKNLLLPSWFAEDFEDESSTSLLGIFFRCIRLIREESSAFSQRIL